MNLNFIWTDNTNQDFIYFSNCLEEYFNNLVGGVENRKSFIPHNSLETIHDVLMVYDNTIPVGCASFKMYDNHVAEVKRVFIDLNYRRLGISKILMENLETRAKSQGYDTLILQTREKCVEAINLYTSIGYHKIDNYEPYVNMPLAICYAKDL